ncbi:MAG: hypothetical protein HY552_04600 [Elusimicrobia bacterium]|nr:hypothetical protein [Elusimicrobiota bacterium]
MPLLAFVVWNQAVPAAAGTAPAPAASTTTLAVVDYVLRTEDSSLDPRLAGYFLTVDLATLPVAKREKARARKVGIEGALKLHEGKKKGYTRFVAGSACQPERHPPSYIPVLQLARYVEYPEEDIDWVERKTSCSEDDLICEFSLQIVVIPRKGKPPLKRYFLHPRDPLTALIAVHRGGVKQSTNFFGTGGYTCRR